MIDDRTIEHLVVHATLTAPSEGFDFNQMVMSHYERGVRTPDPESRSAYHLVITRDGGLITGRRMSEPARLSGALNESAVAVCLVGGLTDEGEYAPNFTAEQWITLGKVYEDLLELYPGLYPLGHKDVSPRDGKNLCPSFDVATWASVYLTAKGLTNDAEQTDRHAPPEA